MALVRLANAHAMRLRRGGKRQAAGEEPVDEFNAVEVYDSDMCVTTSCVCHCSCGARHCTSLYVIARHCARSDCPCQVVTMQPWRRTSDWVERAHKRL
jgi:hypothetical protein